MSDTQLHEILNGLQEAVFILDQDRRILHANRVAESVFGKVAIDTDIIRTIRHPHLVKLIERSLQAEKTATGAITIENPVRTTFNALATRVGKNSDTRIVVSLADISEQKQIEQMRSDFVANVSHELRSPLTSLTGFIETLQGTAKDDEGARARFLELMEREASRMARLVSDLLSLSRLEATERLLPKNECNLAKLMKRVTNSLSDLAASDGKKIRLELETADVLLRGNDDALTQVFQNLIENAIKYSSPNTTVDVKVLEAQGVPGIHGPAIAVMIKDRSDGIPQEHIARLTERFYRVDTDRSRNKGGTGLGLAIVKHIINQHRGRLKIESEMGVGSTFTVYLPKGE